MIRKTLTLAAALLALALPAAPALADPLAKDVFGGQRAPSRGQQLAIGGY